MNNVLSVYKPQGMTPYQLIEGLRGLHPEYKEVKIGFAGRLDPLAHGVMLLTVGEENKNRQRYLNLDKTYQFWVLFGVKTDSYDYLGLVEDIVAASAPNNLEKKINQFMEDNKGKFSQPYPAFSSKTINGVQMYKLAKKDGFEGKKIPKKEVEIFSFKLLSLEERSAIEIKKEILRNLKKIKGHFRQTKIINKWKEFFDLNPEQNFSLANFEIECSSGTYVRSLADKMGRQFNCGAIAFEIFRTKVGDFEIDKALRLDL